MSPIPRKKLSPDLNTLSVPDELKADALAHIQRLDAENRLAIMDANYVRAFKNPPFAKAFMDTYAECVQSKGLRVPPDIQRLLDDPALLSVIEEPYDE
jgi:hypothetical protein